MSYHGLHTTTGEQRWGFINSEEFELIEVSPEDIHGKSPHKPIVWEEGSGLFYEHDIAAFLETLKMIEDGTFEDPQKNPYWERWKYKGDEIRVRLANLPALYKDIKENGIQRPIDVLTTGERLDGSFRSKIALFLGISKIPARLHRLKWEDLTEEIIEKKLKARWLSSGKDYYEFSFGYKDWKNIEAGGPVYQENADRARDLLPLMKGGVLDLGCNEGYISLQAAMAGHEVVGYDHDWIHVAELNKVIFEWIRKEPLPVIFAQKDIREVDCSGFDTILLLNVIYHLPKKDALALLRKCKGTRTIFQCNLRKSEVREEYFGSHPEDLKAMLKEAGMKVIDEVEWKDKPIIIAS